MFFYEGQHCPVCGKAFAENDDIVSCPQCGAPHHRACWQAEGHCHFSEQHGTPEQWTAPEMPTPPTEEATPITPDAPEAPTSPDAPISCPHCGFENPHFAEFCSHCGAPLRETPSPFNSNPVHGEYTPFRHADKPASPEMPIGDTTAKDLEPVVVNNTNYYFRTFKKMDATHSSVSWNWAAFLFGPYWLIYRKNYLIGLITAMFELIFRVFQLIAANRMTGILQGDFATSSTALASFLGTQSGRLFYFILLASFLMTLILHVVLGLFGNRIYMHSAEQKAILWRNNPDARYNLNVFTAGGTTLALAAVAYMLTYFVLNTIAIFL